MLGELAYRHRDEQACDQGQHRPRAADASCIGCSSRYGESDGRRRRHMGDRLEENLAEPDRVLGEAWSSAAVEAITTSLGCRCQCGTEPSGRIITERKSVR